MESISHLLALTPYSPRHVAFSVPPFLTEVQAVQILLAAEHLNLTVTMIIINPLAAGVPHGIGICEHYVEARRCQSELYDIPPETVVTLEYNGFGLIGTFQRLPSFALHLRGSTNDYFLDTRLGGNALTSGDSETQHWKRVSDRIGEFVRKNSPQKVSKVILLGSQAQDPLFRAAVQEALDSISVSVGEPNTTEIFLEEQPGELAAKGAAELCKRQMEAQPGCIEAAHCGEGWESVQERVELEL
jgi:hypothetical protein